MRWSRHRANLTRFQRAPSVGLWRRTQNSRKSPKRVIRALGNLLLTSACIVSHLPPYFPFTPPGPVFGSAHQRSCVRVYKQRQQPLCEYSEIRPRSESKEGGKTERTPLSYGKVRGLHRETNGDYVAGRHLSGWPFLHLFPVYCLDLFCYIGCAEKFRSSLFFGNFLPLARSRRNGPNAVAHCARLLVNQRCHCHVLCCPTRLWNTANCDPSKSTSSVQTREGTRFGGIKMKANMEKR